MFATGVFLYSLIIFPTAAFAAAVPIGGSSARPAPCPTFSTPPHIYCTLAPIGDFVPANFIIKEGGLGGYLNGIVKILVALAGALAVIMIIYGGVQYMLTDSVYGKDAGKKTITNALEGLLLALTAFIILNTINPALLSTQLNSLKPITNLSSVDGGGGVGGGNAGIVAIPETGGALGAGQISSKGLSSWGDPAATAMTGQTINGRQTYFAPGENKSDSNTDAGLGAYGKLIEGTPTTIGSAASVYYPAGTMVKINGIRYIIDDNNLSKQSDGTFKPANDNLTNNYTVDVFTTNRTKANNTMTHYDIEVLYVPPTKVGAQGVQDIRNNPSKYIGS